MATKKKSKKKAMKSKRSPRTKMTLAKTRSKKRSTAKKASPKKPSKKARAKGKAAKAKAIGRKTVATSGQQGRSKSRRREVVRLSENRPGLSSGGQAGDLQGLSDYQGSDSESVRELLEEGNAMEAEVVKGVEEAGDRGDREVRTHEVPEDDVPGEYLDRE
jgi:hypothetical protein